MTDEIDKIILAHLGKNARISSQDIATNLQDLGYTITDRAIRQRFARLEKNNVILGYSAILNPSLVSDKVNRTIILKFKLTKNTDSLVELLTKYVEESMFCTYSSKLNGDFDWICHFVFDSVEQFDLESNNFLSRFGELISDYRSYESKMIKSLPYMIYDEQELKKKSYECIVF